MTLAREFEAEAQAALSQLQSTYGTAELEKSDVAFLMDGWNKILGWETIWKEACWFRWRILVACEELSAMNKAESARKARQLVEENQDPIAKCFGPRTHDGKNLISALFDEQVRSLCPHKQTVQRETYRNATDDRGAAFGLTLECNTAMEIFRLFSTLGIRPSHYVTLCEAFLFSMNTHSPYAKEDDKEDLGKAPCHSSYARFVAQLVAKPGVQDTVAVRGMFATPLYVKVLPEFWNWVKIKHKSFGEEYYTNLLSKFPVLLNYFARSDMDSLTGHIASAVDMMTTYPTMVGESNSSFREDVAHLGEVHRALGMPTEMVYRFASCFAAEFKAVAASRGEEMATLEEQINWQLHKPFEVDCIDNGQVYPAPMSFEPTNLAENLQVGVSLSMSESSASDLISVLKNYLPSEGAQADESEAVKKFNELSVLILAGGKGSEHQDALDSFLSLYPTVVDLLETFAPIVGNSGANKPIPLSDVLAILPRLHPRLYSISSSSVTSPFVVEVSVGVVHARTKDGVHIEGVCSNYLAQLNPMQERAWVSIRTSSFRGPTDIVNTPMLMIGAGTGLAPMMGFLQVKFAHSVTGDESHLRRFVFSLRCYLSQLGSRACYGIPP